MLVIRAEQMKILEQVQLRQFEDSMATHLMRRFPGNPVVADGTQLRSLIREGIQLARTFGVVDRYDVRRFLEFSAEYGADFHTKSWAAKILHDPTLSGCGKMEQIDSYSLYGMRP